MYVAAEMQMKNLAISKVARFGMERVDMSHYCSLRCILNMIFDHDLWNFMYS